MSVAASLAAHGLVVAVIMTAPVKPVVEPALAPPVEVILVEPPPPPTSEPAPGDAPAGGSEAAPAPEPEPAPAAVAVAAAVPVPAKTPEKARATAPTPPTPRPSRPTPRSPQVEPLPISAPEPSVSFVLLGEGALSGALTAGQGSGGGGGAGSGAGGSGGGSGSGVGGGSGQGCDMVKRIQDALRNDPRINGAIGQAYRSSGASGRAILMWNGDWLRSPGEEGKGLAGVRQAIAVTVGFSPRACKAETVNGYVLLTLSDQPGAPRVALGNGGRWRWSDLLSL
ncbi:hypothetical protein [Brevundimonas guildfordensis]|uniref:Uncharacterized protein n=1 Tax=Brevundimonas guildfordensis TaxID=2762241 RepID=A0ABR8R0A9_9CAUL|nr:hypothetical protein [Brevundimonas guildfordensis]MBD7941158.1 hypothetical protein [Brevundimonas guildfordensis]